MYDNLKRYISYVADIDVCKVKSLKSMLKLFGFNYTIFDRFESIPQEIAELIDILSINRRFLTKDGWLKPEVVQLLSSYGVVAGSTADDSMLNPLQCFSRNTVVAHLIQNHLCHIQFQS